ncbi:membrane hypothetical protein [Candidatus Zixiibacteriota bacterium]|nr:membrane hypothetical protein [candidate division Zixibacteria bacterium]
MIPPNKKLFNEEIDIRRWLIAMTWEGALATVFITMTSGAFLTGLALYLGASDFIIGLMAAIPYLMQTFQIPAAFLIDRTGKRKEITVWNSVVARQLWWLIPPLMFLSGQWRLAALIGIILVSNLTIMIATPGWMSWIADLVPDKIRGRYFGYRSAAVAFSTITATIGGGLLLDHFHAINKENFGFALIIAIGALFALAAVILLNRVPDRTTRRVGLNWGHIIRPLKEPKFRHLMRIFIAWNLAIGVAAPFFAAHMLTNLKMSFTLISLYSALGAIVAIILNRPWGRLIDKFGCKPIATICALGISIIPLIWWIPREGHLGILWFEAVYSGALWAGLNLAAFNIPIANSPRGERTTYLAMFSVLSGLAFFASSLIGGLLAENWSHLHWHWGQQIVVNYHLLFALSSLLRFLAALLFFTFRVPKEPGLPVVLQFMGDSVLKWFSMARDIFPHLLKSEPKSHRPEKNNGAY